MFRSQVIGRSKLASHIALAHSSCNHRHIMGLTEEQQEQLNSLAQAVKPLQEVVGLTEVSDDELIHADPVAKAQREMLRAKALSTMLSLYYTSKGIPAEKSLIPSDRKGTLRQLEKKVASAVKNRKAPPRRMVPNVQATARFVRHGVGNLTMQQRRQFDDIIGKPTTGGNRGRTTRGGGRRRGG